VRFGGTDDLLRRAWTRTVHPDTKVSGGRNRVAPATADLIGTGKTANYGVQMQGYAFATGAEK
jgi:hypothetical protein